MEREIKFKAWDGEQMARGSQFDVEAQTGKVFKITPDLQCEYKDWKLMQYTGLKDKNGVEIYEGDILKVWRKPKEGYECIGQVVYSVGYWDIYFKDYFPNRTDLHLWLLDCEVIGNIHQNPELL